MRFYLDEASVKENMAKNCAISIQHWLQSAVENQAVFSIDGQTVEKVLKPESIAVLVRSRKEAELIKNELRQLVLGQQNIHLYLVYPLGSRRFQGRNGILYR